MKKTVQFNKHSIAYEVTGKGNPVMLVHGFGEDAGIWNQLIDFLKEEFLLIIPQLPGTANSAAIDDMSMEGMASVLKAILEEEVPKDKKITLIGHSMGGYITLAFAELYPDSLNAFGLFHSSAYADNDDKKATRKKGIAFIREHGPDEFLKTTIPNLFSPETKDKHPELIDQQIAGLSNFSADSLVSYYEAMMARPDRTPILKKTRVPVLFIAGKYDNAVPEQDMLEQSYLPEISYIHQLNSSGHMGMLEEPEKANQLVKDFLNEL